MKYILIAALAFCGIVQAGTSRAQSVIYSAYDKFDFRAGEFAVVGMAGNKVYTYRSTSEGYFLDAYDDSMNKTATVVLDFFPAKIYQTRFITYTNQIVILYQSVEGNKVVQYAALLDEAGRLKKGPVKLDEIKTGIFGPTREYFSSAVSEDKKTIVVFAAKAKGSEITFEGKWIDDQLNISKRCHAAFKTDNNIEHGEVNVGNDGTVYLSAYTPTGTQDYADQLWLLSLPKETTKFTAKELPLDNQFVTSAYIRVDNANSKVYVGGFYTHKKNGSYEGLLYAAYDIASGAFPNRKMIPFDADLLNGVGSSNKKRAFDNYQVRQIIAKKDGGFVMISETYYITLRSNYSPGFGYYSSYYSPFMSQSVREYHYNDIMALSYDGNGNKEWGAFIPKEQYSQEDGGVFSSYALLNSGGTLAFMFNDFNTNHSHIQLATLDAGGKLAMNSFTAEGNDYPDWLPRSGKQVAGRVIVVPCLHKRQICFAKVVF